MLPEYEKQNVTPPKLETISTRIEEVLLQQQVGSAAGGLAEVAAGAGQRGDDETG